MDYKSLGLTLIEDFITKEEEQVILGRLDRRVAQKKSNMRNNIQRYGSDIPYRSSMVSAQIPDYLEVIAQKIFDQKLINVKPDSVSINQYLTGQGISPHIDSKASGAIITILSILGTATMKFVLDKSFFTVELPPRSLVQMRGVIRDKYQHSIEPVKSERYSIVFRVATK